MNTPTNAGIHPAELAALRAKLLDQRAFRREQLAALRREAALDRMSTGHYGQCRSCRGPIDLARLRICPQALYCAECHRLQETR
ncbi:TraR/DksA C4-type zinc finger protein [Kribbella sp. HUAS MG21]|uniref:TraR/DksA C4-type zinc finger protein n=1 Tax=Kribbella sp. HUAS MG21 TaxID=3160966 RepID=A0AAU7T4K7_9ACTN